MARIRWYTGDEMVSQLERMQREMGRLLANARPGHEAGAGPTRSPQVYPPINLYKNDEGFIVRAELPGVDPQSLDLEITGDTLTLGGERRAPELAEGASFHRRERSFGRFRRSVTVPEMVDNSKVSATCRNGVLEIFLPPAEQARHRRVEIKAL